MEDQNKPVIDVIIPAYRPDDSFQKLIGLLQEQTVKPHHIYVLQTMGEGDELMQPMNSDMTVHSVAKKDFDHGATRDYGARLAAEGNQAASDRHYILFMTQDAVPANTHLIETLAKAFEDERTAIAYARQLAREGADVVEELFAETDDGESPELETARALVQRQYAAKLAAGKRDQVAAALARRGFSHAVIREVLSDDE